LTSGGSNAKSIVSSDRFRGDWAVAVTAFEAARATEQANKRIAMKIEIRRVADNSPHFHKINQAPPSCGRLITFSDMAIRCPANSAPGRPSPAPAPMARRGGLNGAARIRFPKPIAHSDDFGNAVHATPISLSLHG
jgi:hypothetical protein